VSVTVGVVIPAYNVRSYIGDALTSVLAQDLADWECIVVDDGSTDDTAAVVATFDDPRIRLVSQPNAGVSAARNEGIRQTSAEAIVFLDGDDTLHPTALRRLRESLMRHPEAVLAFGTSLRMTPSGEIEPGQKDPERHAYVTGDVLPHMLVHDRVFWNGGQILARTRFLREAGGYRSGLRLSEDWEFFCRLSALGPCAFIGPQEEVLRHRVRPGSAAPTLGLEFDNHLPAIDVVFGNDDLRDRFPARQWKAMRNSVVGDHQFETGRQNFAQRRFTAARRHMFLGALRAPTRRRLAILALAGPSRVLGRPLAGPLRFHAEEVGGAARE
jgi:glycosyltransferase involved in cell wall biosynthesis